MRAPPRYCSVISGSVSARHTSVAEARMYSPRLDTNSVIFGFTSFRELPGEGSMTSSRTAPSLIDKRTRQASVGRTRGLSGVLIADPTLVVQSWGTVGRIYPVEVAIG